MRFYHAGHAPRLFGFVWLRLRRTPAKMGFGNHLDLVGMKPSAHLRHTHKPPNLSPTMTKTQSLATNDTKQGSTKAFTPTTWPLVVDLDPLPRHTNPNPPRLRPGP